MNGGHHISLTEWVGYSVGLRGDALAQLARASAEPDHLVDVVVTMPGKGQVSTWRGQKFSSLTHFEHEDGSGFCWDRDKSLGILDTAGDVLMWAGRCYVGGSSAPMVHEIKRQKRTTLDNFCFPSLSRMGSHWSTFPVGGREAGWMCHAVQDACIWHHATGRLLDGHAGHENKLQAWWEDHLKRGELGSKEVLAACLREAVDKERVEGRTVEAIIKENLAWARRWFAKDTDHGECTGGQALAVCVRAIASTMAALQIMKGAA